ncbi:MAG: FkbM family methyltransferase [Planktomarina sp.]
MTFDPTRHTWLRTTLATQRLTHIVDVGANPAEEVPYKPLLDAAGCRLTGFEPQKEAYEKLLKIKGPLETYHQFAVGDGSRKVLNLMAHDTMTSFFEGDMDSAAYLKRFGPAMQIKQKVMLDTVALDHADDVDDFDVLKIDIQGGELDVFRGGAAKLARALVVIPEVRMYQLYKGEPMFAGIDTDLRARGFALHSFMFIKDLILPNSQIKRMRQRANAHQMIDGDAVYIRDLAYPNRYSDEDLKHLAILADGLFFAADLVVRCLDMLVARKAVDPGLPAAYVDRLPPEKLMPQAPKS